MSVWLVDEDGVALEGGQLAESAHQCCFSPPMIDHMNFGRWIDQPGTYRVQARFDDTDRVRPSEVVEVVVASDVEPAESPVVLELRPPTLTAVVDGPGYGNNQTLVSLYRDGQYVRDLPTSNSGAGDLEVRAVVQQDGDHELRVTVVGPEAEDRFQPVAPVAFRVVDQEVVGGPSHFEMAVTPWPQEPFVLHVFNPDGSPAAGATVEVRWPWTPDHVGSPQYDTGPDGVLLIPFSTVNEVINVRARLGQVWSDWITVESGYRYPTPASAELWPLGHTTP